MVVAKLKNRRVKSRRAERVPDDERPYSLKNVVVLEYGIHAANDGRLERLLGCFWVSVAIAEKGLFSALQEVKGLKLTVQSSLAGTSPTTRRRS